MSNFFLLDGAAKFMEYVLCVCVCSARSAIVAMYKINILKKLNDIDNLTSRSCMRACMYEIKFSAGKQLYLIHAPCNWAIIGKTRVRMQLYLSLSLAWIFKHLLSVKWINRICNLKVDKCCFLWGFFFSELPNCFPLNFSAFLPDILLLLSSAFIY